MKQLEKVAITIEDKEYFIKSFLTTDEKKFLINKTLEAYELGLMLEDGSRQKDEIYGFDKNPLSKNITFDIITLNLVCEEFTELDYELLKVNGVFEAIKEINKDVFSTFSMIDSIIDKKDSAEYAIVQFLDKLIEKIPNAKDIQKMSKSIIKDLANPKNKEVIDGLKDLITLKTNNVI